MRRKGALALLVILAALGLAGCVSVRNRVIRPEDVEAQNDEDWVVTSEPRKQ